MPSLFASALKLLVLSPHLLRMQGRSLVGLDTGPEAARRSFTLMLFMLPVYLFSVDTLADAELRAAPLHVLAPVLITDYVLQWVMFPMLIIGLAMMARMPLATFPAFVIVNNCLASLSSILALPLLILYRMKALSEDAFFIAMTILFLSLSVILSRWASLLFKAGIGFGVVVFLLSSFSGQSISMMTMEILRKYVGS